MVGSSVAPSLARTLQRRCSGGKTTRLRASWQSSPADDMSHQSLANTLQAAVVCPPAFELAFPRDPSVGLPRGWTVPARGSVIDSVAAVCPWHQAPQVLNLLPHSSPCHILPPEAGLSRHPTVSLFFGVLGLELGLSQLGPQC